MKGVLKMRIFDKFCFDISDKIEFSDTKEYLEKMLAELGYSYEHIGFIASTWSEVITNRAYKHFPEIGAYHRKDHLPQMSSQYFGTPQREWRNGALYFNADCTKFAEDLFRKIPSPLKFDIAELFFDGINWFQDSDCTPAIDGRFMREHEDAYPGSSGDFMCNRISICRTKHEPKKNFITVTIEVTAEPHPRESSIIVNKLKSYLGTPESENIHICIFSAEEIAHRKMLELPHNKKLEEYWKKIVADSEYYAEYNQQLKGIVTKKLLESAFSDTGFELQSYKDKTPGTHTLTCLDKHGFQYTAWMQFAPYHTSTDFMLSIKSFNFGIGMRSRFSVKEESEVPQLLQKIADFCVLARDEIGDELSLDFGDKPEWY